jgi:hypothetical protein
MSHVHLRSISILLLWDGMECSTYAYRNVQIFYFIIGFLFRYSLFLAFFFFFAVLGFELRALCLLTVAQPLEPHVQP